MARAPKPLPDLWPFTQPLGGGLARLAVKVTPKAASNRIEIDAKSGDIKVYVTAPALEGRANDAVRDLLAEALNRPKTALALKAGEHSRQKIYDVQMDE